MKKWIHKVLFVLLTSVLVYALLPKQEVKAEVYQGMVYSIKNNDVTICGYENTVASEVVIPDTIAGYPVTAIAKNAFRNCTNLVSIVIPETVRKVGSEAFRNCKNLKKVTIPGTIEDLGRYSFADCYQLNYHVYENGKYLGNAENHCIALMGVVNKEYRSFSAHPDTRYVDYEAFSGCTNISRVYIGSNVGYVGCTAFDGCNSYASIFFAGNPPRFLEATVRVTMGYKGYSAFYHTGNPNWNTQLPQKIGSVDVVWKTGHIYSDGYHCVCCDAVNTKYSGLLTIDGVTYYWKDGAIAEDVTLLYFGNGGPYYIVKGKLATGFTGLLKDNKMDRWYYIKNGVADTKAVTLVKHNGDWYYVFNGTVAFDVTKLVKFNGSWYYVKNGKVASQTTTVLKDGKELYYVKNGKIASQFTGLMKHDGTWYYFKNGRVGRRTTGLVKWSGEWWYVRLGKVATDTTTLVNHSGGWYYIYKGKLAAKTTTLVKYNGGWYYVEKGTINWGFSGKVLFNNGTYTVKNGKVLV